MDKIELISAEAAWWIIGVGKTQFYKLAKYEGFSRPYRIGKRTARWDKCELTAWPKKKQK